MVPYFVATCHSLCAVIDTSLVKSPLYNSSMPQSIACSYSPALFTFSLVNITSKVTTPQDAHMERLVLQVLYLGLNTLDFSVYVVKMFVSRL